MGISTALVDCNPNSLMVLSTGAFHRSARSAEIYAENRGGQSAEVTDGIFTDLRVLPQAKQQVAVADSAFNLATAGSELRLEPAAVFTLAREYAMRH